MSEALIAVALVWVAASGTAVVLTRDPLHQAFVAGFFGLALAFLYLSMQAGTWPCRRSWWAPSRCR